MGCLHLALEKNESAATYCGRARGIFTKAEKEGIVLPSVARGFLLLDGTNLPDERQAVGILEVYEGGPEVASPVATARGGRWSLP